MQFVYNIESICAVCMSAMHIHMRHVHCVCGMCIAHVCTYICSMCIADMRTAHICI